MASRFLIIFLPLLAAVFCREEKPRLVPRRDTVAVLRQFLGANSGAGGFTAYKVALPAGSPPLPAVLKNLRLEIIQLGRFLFYDPALSADGSLACGDCHKQAEYFADKRRFSPGIHGRNVGRNAMSLINLAWSDRFFWDGRVNGLQNLIPLPISHPDEMDQKPEKLVERLNAHPVYPDLFRRAFGTKTVSMERISRAVSEFLLTIISYDAPIDHLRQVEYDLRKLEELSSEARQGLVRNLTRPLRVVKNICATCHVKVMYGGEMFENNGLDSSPQPGAGRYREKEFGRFKVPSLRGIHLTPPYMHDGRFATLEEVINHYDHGITESPSLSPLLRDRDGKPMRLNLSPAEKQEIIHLLKLWTDEKITRNRFWADPFRGDDEAGK